MLVFAWRVEKEKENSDREITRSRKTDFVLLVAPILSRRGRKENWGTGREEREGEKKGKKY